MAQRVSSQRVTRARVPEPAPKRAVFPRPVLCAVLDIAALGEAPGVLARDLFRAGVDWIQLRDRIVPAEILARAATALIEARETASRDLSATSDAAGTAGTPGTAEAKASPFRILINKRVDVAIVTGADGVHLGGDALSPAHASQALPETAMIGASFHAEDEILRALDAGRTRRLDYGHLAPIWDPRSKPLERPALGPERLRSAAALGLPLIAQGGLDAGRAQEAISMGATGIAVTGLLTQAADPISVARALRDALDRADAQAG